MSDMEDLFKLGLRSDETVEDDAADAEGVEEKHIDGAAPHLVEAFCVALSRLEIGRRLYKEGNKLLILMKERVVESWRLINVSGDSISLDIEDSSMLYHDIVVFHQKERDTMANRLYADGIRRLTFTSDMKVEDAFRFVTIFDKQDEWQSESDCADRLWILDLKGIRYQAVDGFDELVKETRGSALKNSAAVMSQLTGNENELSKLDGEGGPAKQESGWGKTSRYDVDPDGMYHLQKELEELGGSNEEFWGLEGQGVVGQTFTHCQKVVSFAIQERSFKPQVLSELAERMFHEQLRLDDGGMVERIKVALDQPEPMASVMSAAWTKVAEPKFFTALLSDAAAGSPRQRALTALMEKYLKIPPRDLVAAVLANPTLSAADSLIEMLHTSYGGAIRYWRPHLKALPDEILIEICGYLGEDDLLTESGQKLIEKLFASTNPDLAVLAATVAPMQSLKEHREVLLERLEDPVEEVRLSSSLALRTLKDPTCGVFVLNMLRHVDEKQLTQAEVGSLLHTLMILGGDRYLPFLEQCLGPLVKTVKGLFGSTVRRRGIGSHVNPLGDRPVLRALVRHGSPASMAIVKEAYKNSEPELKSFISVVRVDPEAETAQKAKVESSRVETE